MPSNLVFSGVMPANFGDDLSDEQITDIISFICFIDGDNHDKGRTAERANIFFIQPGKSRF